MKFNKNLSYEGKIIPYTLILKEQKYIRLKLEDDKIVVSAPVISQDWEIELLIYKNIKKILIYLEKKQKYKKISFEIGNEFIYIFNEKKKIEFYSEKEPINTNLEVFYFKKYDVLEDTIKAIYKKLSSIYINWFKNQTNKYLDILNVEVKNISVKVMKNKWGVCFPEKSKIIYNPKLLHFNTDAIEYVILHEVTHLIHKNHSKDFWATVQKVMPNYKIYASQLNE